MKFDYRLESLRGIAVLMVFVAHFPLLGIAYIDDFLTVLKMSKIGYVGVEIFFVLSGYLITRILDVEIRKYGARLSLYRFYVKRAFRILPVMYLCILVCAIALPGYNYLYPSLMLSNYYFSFYDGSHPLRHFWSLAVEEQFYLAWPLLLIFVSNRNHLVFLIKALVFIAFLVVGLREVAGSDVSKALIYRSLETRMAALSIGAAFGILGIPRLTLVKVIALFFLGAVISYGSLVINKLYGFDVSASGKAVGFLMISVAAFIFINVYGDSVSFLLRNRFLMFTGKISYGLYVYHLPILFLLGMSHMDGSKMSVGIDSWVGALFLVYAVSTVSWYLMERPALKVKDRVLSTVKTKDPLKQEQS